MMTIDMSEPIKTPGNDRHECQIGKKAVIGFQTTIFNGASRFKDFEIDFNMPTTTIPFDTGNCIG